MPRIRTEIARAENVIVESNSILRFLRPDFSASVLDPDVADFKPTALRYLDRVDAILVAGGTLDRPEWKDVSLSLIESIPRFQIVPPNYSSSEFAAFVSQKLAWVER
jgi:hypothetical protein